MTIAEKFLGGIAMKIYITGGTGFIGNALASYWQQQGHHVAVITRGKPEQHSQGDPKSQAREGPLPLTT